MRLSIIAVLFGVLATGIGPAQLQPRHAIVASHDAAGAGGRRALLLDVDLRTGVVIRLGRFGQDVHPPLALAHDPIRGEVLLALDVGGSSRVVRLGLSGTTVVFERVLADLPGRVAALAVAGVQDVSAIVDGPQGGIVRIPRNGGPAATVRTLPRLGAVYTYPPHGDRSGLIAQSGGPQASPGLTLVDLETGTTYGGPWLFGGFPTSPITAIADLPTDIPRALVADAGGTVSLSLIYRTPTPIALTPQLPPGATRALRLEPGPSFSAIVLGGSADPFLKSFQVLGGPQSWQFLAGPLPGDPVDFFLVPAAEPDVLSFGAGCPGVAGRTPQIDGGVTGGPPRLGNPTFQIAVHGANPAVTAVLSVGFDDRSARGVPLPLRITAACSLYHSADVAVPRVTSAAGFAAVVLPVPNDPALAGARVFAQWFAPGGVGGTPLSASDAAVVHVLP